jgi:dynactin complex subunit
MRLKDFKFKEQESSISMQKDKVLTQKQEERIKFLMETNELLKLTETKLRNKVEDLRSQLSNFMERVKARDKDIEEREN